MTLEELRIVIKAETTGVDKAVEDIKRKISSMSNAIDSSLGNTGRIGVAAGKNLRDKFNKEIDKLLEDTDKKLMELNNLIQKTSQMFGWDSPEAESIGISSDKLGYYYEELKKVKNEFNSAFDTDDITNSFDKLQSSLESITMQGMIDEVDKYTAKLDEATSKIDSTSIDLNVKGVDGLQTQIDEAKNKTENLIKKFAELNNVSLDGLKTKIEKLNIEYPSKGLGGENNKGGDKLGKTATTFAKALLGVRGLYMLLRKIINNNERITTAVDNLITSLSNLLSPILNSIADILSFFAAILSSIVSIFKINVGTKKNTGDTAKNTASFDEINNLQSSSGADSSADIPSLKDAWNNLSTLQKIISVGLIIAAIAAIIKKVLELKAIISPIAKKVIEYIGTLGKKIGEFIATHLQQIAGVAVIIAGIIMLVQSVIDYLNDPSWNNFGNILIDIGVILAGVALALGAWPVALAAAIVAALGLVAKFHDQIASFIEKIKGWIDNAITWIQTNISTMFPFIGSVIEGILQIVKGCIDGIWKIIDGVVTGLKQILDGIILMFKGDFKAGLKLAWEGIKTMLKGIVDGMWSIIKGVLNAIIAGFEGMVNAAIKGLNKLTSGLRSIGNKVLDFIGVKSFSFTEISTIKLPRLATGTNYVPKDMVAMLHKGEAVVPAKYNNNNEETNNLLRQLISVVDSKEFKAYISKNEIGKTAVNYINQQSRIMGGALI